MSLLKCKIGSFLASLYLRLFDTFDRKLNLLMTGFEPQISGYEAPILPTVPQPLPKAKQLFVVQSRQTVRPQIFYDRKSFTNWRTHRLSISLLGIYQFVKKSRVNCQLLHNWLIHSLSMSLMLLFTNRQNYLGPIF